MTEKGKKLSLPRDAALQVAQHLSGEEFSFRRRGVRLPGIESCIDAGAASERVEANRIGGEIQRQLDTRRKMSSGMVVIVLSHHDVRWLSLRLPTQYRLFAPPPAYALAMFGFWCRHEDQKRRGRRWVWPDERKLRVEAASKLPQLPEAKERTFRRDLHIIELEESSEEGF